MEYSDESGYEIVFEKLYFGMRSSENGFLDAPNLRLALGGENGRHSMHAEGRRWSVYI